MKLNDPFVITISREVGSGGGSVGRKLAEKLNVNYINKQLMQALEEKFNLTSGGIEHLKSKKKNWFTDLFEQLTPAPKATIRWEDIPSPVNSRKRSPLKTSLRQKKKSSMLSQMKVPVSSPAAPPSLC